VTRDRSRGPLGDSVSRVRRQRGERTLKQDVEDVVDNRTGYDVVRKHSGEPTRVAEATDPRSD